MRINAATFGPGEAALPAAVLWLEDALLGSAASAIAIIAIGFVGFAMLSGRLDWRMGARVALGIFILFGAPTIARELMALSRGDGLAAPAIIADDPVPAQPSAPNSPPPPDPFFPR